MSRGKRSNTDGGEPGQGAAGMGAPPSPPPVGLDVGLPPDPADPAPPKLADGRPNLAYLQWKYRRLSALMMAVIQGEAKMPFGLNLAQVKDLFDAEAKHVYKVEPKHLMDVRSDAQVQEDAVNRLIEAPDSIFDWPAERLARMKEEMDKSDKHCCEELHTASSEARRFDGLTPAERAEKKRRWSDLLAGVIQAQTRARSPVPQGTFNGDAHGIRASHPLRFMVYTGTSGMTDRENPTAVFRIGRHHARMAVQQYLCDHDLEFIGGEVVTCPRWKGVKHICPPGHSKTTFATHVIVLRIDQNTRMKWLFGHAQAKKAEQNLAYAATYFDPEEATGRRNRALFPELPPIEKRNSSILKLKQKEPQSQPTIAAFGITAKIAGYDADGVWQDDAVDFETRDQEAERERTHDRINSQWRARLRGKQAKEIDTATLWHHQDSNCKDLKAIRDGKLRMKVSLQKCGGPDHKPPFEALWPEVIPSSEVKAKFMEWGNPRLFAATYESNPMPDSSYKVKGLAYFDPDTDEHRAFLASGAASFWVSVDPTASEDEKADEAMFVWAAKGDVVTVEDGQRTYTPRLRILGCKAFHADQVQLTTELMAFCEFHEVHNILFETRSGFRAAADIWENEMGLEPCRIDPGNRPKALRLGDVAPMLDASNIAKGLPSPVVEFMGQVNADGSLGPHEDLEDLVKQILDFGSHPKDHGVDAVTQLCKWLGPELGVGVGGITRKIQQTVRACADSRLEKIFQEMEAGSPGDTSDQDDYRWAMNALGVGR